MLSHALEAVYGSAIHDHTSLLSVSLLVLETEPLSIHRPSLLKFERPTTDNKFRLARTFVMSDATVLTDKSVID
jgi:hypothetical protein